MTEPEQKQPLQKPKMGSRFISRVASTLKAIDKYGKPISLSYGKN